MLPGLLQGIRVLEIADEKAAHCGKLLAAQGADVLKIEPPWGDPSRHYGPFAGPHPDPERSLHFWHYNLNKRGLTLDLRSLDGGQLFRQLVRGADIVVDATPIDFLRQYDLHYEALHALNAGLLMVSVTPFGQHGPYRHYKASDLIHLALGGIMAICGYDPNAEGHYDTPPIAPQMWHAYHIASHHAFIGLLGALFHRHRTGVGQCIDISIHDTCSANTEFSMPYFMYNELLVQRLTHRHAYPYVTLPVSHRARDDYYVCAGSLPNAPSLRRVARLVVEAGVADPALLERLADDAWAESYEAREELHRYVQQYIASHTAEEVYHTAQAYDLAWGAIRRPEDNLTDAQFRARGNIVELEHEGFGKLPYTTAPWLADKVPWQVYRRAPRLGEHNEEIYGGELGIGSHTLQQLRATGVI
jgi:crotonobetainyl-CoA:carnitine CoA-transferase CaiB-like acyl-CoA transferase